MKYYYDYENDVFFTDSELEAEYAEYFVKGYTEAETAEEYVSNVMDTGNVIEVSEHVYDGRDCFYKVRAAINSHIASYHASWMVDITADGTAFSLNCEDNFICAIEIEDVIPALDYLYSVVGMDSTAEQDAMALDMMVSTWGL